MGIKTAYMPLAGIGQQSKSWQESVFGTVSFGTNPRDDVVTEIPTIHLPTQILAGENLAAEMWLSHQALSQNKTLINGKYGAIQYRANEEMLFGVISLREKNTLQSVTESAYREIFVLMQTLDYPHIYRFWNYMADINGTHDGLERYRQFNIGRKEAFAAFENGIGDQLPAACALGLADGPLTIAFLLGRDEPIAVENPRQMNAFEYPDEYGPRTPSFSRATLLGTGQDAVLFISGTASIVGHLTQHTTDVAAQTRETLVNIEAVIAEANRIVGRQQFDLKDIFFRVYIRHAADLTSVRDAIKHYMGGPVKALFVQADICRQELLLEIEATAGSTLAD